MARYSALRASDADREHVAERLRDAAAEGRLLAEELEQRLASALRARTYGELDAVVADLPTNRVARRSSRSAVVLARPALALAIALATVAVVAVAVLVITGLVAAWALWTLFAWWMFRGRCGPRRRRAMHRHGHWQVSRQAERRAGL